MGIRVLFLLVRILKTIYKTEFIAGDGQLSFDEFSNHAADNPIRHELFNHFDANKDGFLQKAETDAIYAAMDQTGMFKTRLEFQIQIPKASVAIKHFYIII